MTASMAGCSSAAQRRISDMKAPFRVLFPRKAASVLNDIAGCRQATRRKAVMGGKGARHVALVGESGDSGGFGQAGAGQDPLASIIDTPLDKIGVWGETRGAP